VEKQLEQVSPGLPDEEKESKLVCHFINSLSEKVSLQLKLQSKFTMQKLLPKPESFT